MSLLTVARSLIILILNLTVNGNGNGNIIMMLLIIISIVMVIQSLTVSDMETRTHQVDNFSEWLGLCNAADSFGS